MSKCQQCGASFHGGRSHRRYCGAECRSLFWKERHDAGVEIIARIEAGELALVDAHHVGRRRNWREFLGAAGGTRPIS